MEIWFQIVVGVFIVGLAAFAFVSRRRNRSTDIVLYAAAENEVFPAPFNPLGSMTFEMLVNGDVSPAVMKEQAVVHVTKTLGARGLDVSNLVAQAEAALSQKDVFVATFSREVQKKLSDGSLVLMQKEGGGKMLAAVTKRGHKIVEHGTVAKTPMTAAKVANVTALVVSAAHMISAYDNAMKLKAVDKKIGTLIRRQENEMVGRLEAIYELLNERMSLASEPDPATMLYLKLQLKELRGTWLRNLEGALLEIETPESQNRVKKWFSRTFCQDRKLAKGVESAVSQQEINVHLIRVTIFLEQIIASVLGEGDAFNQITLVPIRSAIERIAKLMDEKKAYIAKLSGQSPDDVGSQSTLVKRLGESLDPQGGSEDSKRSA